MNNILFMLRSFKPILFLLSVVLFLPGLNAQNGNSIKEDIAEKFINYCERVPWEDVYIHTDRDEYIAGESIWFSTWLSDRLSLKLSDASRIVYFEVLNWENKPVIRKRIGVEGGFGKGVAILPDTLSSGSYTIRAYTNWMKNFLPFNCFIKKINVFNAINFTPFTNRSDSGNLYKDEGAGIDSDSYMEKGINVKVVPGTDTIRILIEADEAFRSGNGNRCYLFIQTHGKIDVNEDVILTAKKTSLSVPINSLNQGINQITLFNNSGKPFFEKYVFTPPGQRNNLVVRSTAGLEPRSRISLEIDTEIIPVKPSERSALSISVTPHPFSIHSQDIVDYMVFGSEFGVLPDAIRSMKLVEIDRDSLDDFLTDIESKWIDWDVILSGNYPEIRYLHENDNHYLSGTLINQVSLTTIPGKYIFLSSPSKVAGFQYSLTDKNGNFSLHIPISRNINDIIIQPEEADKGNIINMGTSFSELYSPAGEPSSDTDYIAPEYISKMSSNYQISKIYGLSTVGEAEIPSDKLPDRKRFYGKPDIELIMDDYIKLPVMEEVFFELLPGVNMKRAKSGYEITLMNNINKKEFNVPPGLLVDGVIIKDATAIAEIDPELVEKIDVVTENYLVGDYMFYGLLNVITIAGDCSNADLPDHAVRLQYRAVDPVFPFSSPDYSIPQMKQNRIPDFRNTLYWNPSLKPGVDNKIRIEFWTSDYPSDYIIDIQGLTSEGRPLSFRKIIKNK